MRQRYRVLDLFSGIGGFSLGLERTGGFETVAFCEIEPFPRRVLAKHWPTVPVYDDVRTLTARQLAADGICVDVICGGFPCQDISTAGAGAGLDGERSGLWREIARLAGELRPRYLIVENVAALLHRGLDRVLGDLAAIGYDAEWHCIPASAVGAPHRRDRLWLVADSGTEQHGSGRAPLWGTVASQFLARDPNDGRQSAFALDDETPRLPRLVADAASKSEREPATEADPVATGGTARNEFGRGRQHVADANDTGREEQWGSIAARTELRAAQCGGWWLAEPRVGQPPDGLPCRLAGPWAVGWEDGIPRVVHGVPERVAKLRALGNAVVPQVVEMIGRAVLAVDGAN